MAYFIAVFQALTIGYIPGILSKPYLYFQTLLYKLYNAVYTLFISCLTFGFLRLFSACFSSYVRFYGRNFIANYKKVYPEGLILPEFVIE